MTKEVTNIGDISIENALVSIDKMQDMCKKLMATKHYSRMGEEGVFAIIQKAKSLGLDPIDALGGSLFYIQGKVGMSSETMASLIRQAGHSVVKDQKSDNSICILHGKRKDNGDTWTCVFSMDDAKRAGLAKGMYDKYPAVMLYNRCMSMLARQLFPDVIKGSGYTLDELKEIAKVEEYNPKAEQQTIEIPASAFMVTKPEAPASKPEVKKPTAEEIIALSEILEQCDPDFVAGKMKAIKKSFGSEDLNDINIATYIRLLDLAMKNKQEYFEKMMDVPEAEKDDA